MMHPWLRRARLGAAQGHNATPGPSPFAITHLSALPFCYAGLTTTSAGALIQITIVSVIHLRPDYRAPLHVIVRRRPLHRVPHTYNPLFYFKLTTIISPFIARVRLTSTSAGALNCTRSAGINHLRPAHRATLHVIVMRGPKYKPRRGFYPPPTQPAWRALHACKIKDPRSAGEAWRGDANHDLSGSSITTTSAGALNCARSASEIHLRPDYRATLHVIVRRRPPCRIPYPAALFSISNSLALFPLL
jgi:hypothetical protein